MLIDFNIQKVIPCLGHGTSSNKGTPGTSVGALSPNTFPSWYLEGNARYTH